MKRISYFSFFIYSILVMWIFLLLSRIFIKSNINENIIFLSAFFAHLFILIFVFQIYIKMKTEDKNIFKWMIISAIGLFFNDLSFYIGIVLPHNLLINLPTINFILDFIFYLTWLFAIPVFLSKLAVKRILSIQDFFKFLTLFLFINFIVIAIFASSIPYAFGDLSWQVISQIFSFAMEFIIFDLIILGLIHTVNRGVSYLFVGITILISGDFFIDYSFVSQTKMLLSYGQLLWLFGLFLVLLGLWNIKKDQSYVTKDWFRKSSNIKSKLAFWTFAVSTISFIAFFFIAFAFSLIDKNVFTGLPFFIMIYSVLIIILSLYTGRNFERPFKKIANNIEALMLNNDNSRLDSNFSIEEFIFLQKFITDVYNLKEERDRAKKKLGELTAQVAHDIKSPTAALLVLAQTCTDIPEADRIALREAAYSIRDIANNVLNQYHLGDEPSHNIDHDKKQDLLMSGLILEMISEKRLQYKERDIQFDFNFSPGAYFAFVKGHQARFKRMLSNVINNAVDACHDSTGKILLSLNISDLAITLSVRDNGKGMPAHVIQKIMQAEVITEGKDKGHGIGLAQVRETLREYEGQLEIDSVLNEGTTVRLIFSRLCTPGWMADQMLLSRDALVIVLDDDHSIHTAWDHRLKPVLEQSPHLQVMHFKEGQAVIDYVANLTENDKKRLFLLTDYELLKQTVNGLDVLKATRIQHSILVTSHYANSAILECSILLNAKILPKLLVAELPIALKPDSIVSHDKEAALSFDVVVVDDKPQFMQILINYYLKGKTVKLYDSPYLFLAEYTKYAKTTPICLDNNFGIIELNGRMLAKKLHEEGYTCLYLISGTEFDDLPPYLKAIDKNKLAEVLC